MKNILETNVSVFENYLSPKPLGDISLYDWLTSKGYKKEITRIRRCKDSGERQKLKRLLPAITPSGIFTERRSIDTLLRHSGLICIDIDGKENSHISNWESVKQKMAGNDNIAYCGLSASGNGIFMLIPIAYTDKHLQHFNALESYFSLNHAIQIDKACKDICRLRGISFDSNPVINLNAQPITSLIGIVNKGPFKATGSIEEVMAAKQVLNQILSLETDVTETYTDWLCLGCAIANILGEEGRTIYHDISSFSSVYKKSECDKQFSACLKHNYPYTIATLFYILKKHK